MAELNLNHQPHRRLNLLTGEWVLVSPHRTERPWQGRMEATPSERRPAYDHECYLCPGNARAGGARNPDFTSTFVFDNDFSALTPDVPATTLDIGGMLRAEGEAGLCRVMCFSPRHDLTLPVMDRAEIREVVDVWTREYAELGSRPDIHYVQIFENKGEMMGCSNPHPHCQIWAQRTVPDQPRKELARMREHHAAHGRSLLADYLALELELEERLICANDAFVALVPFWATWPFESLVISRRPVASLLELEEQERTGLADILKRLTTRYDNLFQVSFPYSAGLHQAPTDGREYPEWHLHMHFYPPLLRSATVRKFMVGYEMLGTPQRDITAEASASRLRELPEIHFGESARSVTETRP